VSDDKVLPHADNFVGAALVLYTTKKISGVAYWFLENVGCTAFEVDHLVVEHHFANWLWGGRIRWYPIVSKSLGRGFYELEHPKWFCPADRWRVWEPPAAYYHGC
jgi:hypothetical protein